MTDSLRILSVPASRERVIALFHRPKSASAFRGSWTRISKTSRPWNQANPGAFACERRGSFCAASSTDMVSKGRRADGRRRTDGEEEAGGESLGKGHGLRVYEEGRYEVHGEKQSVGTIACGLGREARRNGHWSEPGGNLAISLLPSSELAVQCRCTCPTSYSPSLTSTRAPCSSTSIHVRREQTSSASLCRPAAC